MAYADFTGYRPCRVCAIFEFPHDLRHLCPEKLVYVEMFSTFKGPDYGTQLYTTSHSLANNQGGSQHNAFVGNPDDLSSCSPIRHCDGGSGPRAGDGHSGVLPKILVQRAWFVLHVRADAPLVLYGRDGVMCKYYHLKLNMHTELTVLSLVVIYIENIDSLQ